jgi:hypothetical protein
MNPSDAELTQAKPSFMFVALWKNYINKGSHAKSTLAYIFFRSSKFFIFATTYKFQRGLSLRNFEFLPKIKIIACFQKKL